MVEGIRVNDPTNSRGGAFDFFALDPYLIERIEVSREAVSAVHGSDALSGAVNVLLRRPESGGLRPFGHALLGSGREVEAAAGLSEGWGSGGWAAAGSFYDSDRLQAGSRLRRHQAFGQLAQRLGGFELRAIGAYARSERQVFPEDSGGPDFAVNRALEQGTETLKLAGLSIRRDAAAAVRPNLTVSYSEHRASTDTPAIAPGALSPVPALTSTTRFTRFEATGDVGVRRGPVSATAGAAYLDESGRSTGTIDFGFRLPVAFRLTRETVSGFAEATVRPGGGFSINVAGRYDAVRSGPHRFTKRAAAAWRGRRGLTVFAVYGEGYKLPSFYALAHPLIGNPALRPERSINLEAGAEQTLGKRARVRLTLFRNRYRDLVDFDPQLFKTVNRASVGARGAELEGEATLPFGLAIRASVSYLDLSSATPLRNRPEWQGSLGLAWKFAEGFELSGTLRANSSFLDSSIPTGLVGLEGHGEVDLSLRFRAAPRLVVTASVRNATGARYQQAVGFPAPGRTVRIGLGTPF
jgi:iron complex outermembrane receptor protein/vitamin B12 transporter